MQKMLDWLTRFIWISEIIFLAASTPHIATYFEHFDNPTGLLSTVYSWGVAYGLALLIDGISFTILLSMLFSVKYRRGGWLVAGLIIAMIFVSSLSWFINWQYALVFSSKTFASADKVAVNVLWLHSSIGDLNPIIGGAFPFFSVVYALVAKAIQVSEEDLSKTAMSPEQFEMEKARVRQEQELKALRRSGQSGKGLLTMAQETVMGRSSDADELLNRTLSFLHEARNLLENDQEERALQALSGYLKIRAKEALPLLIQARSVIEQEEQDAVLRQERLAEEERDRRARLDHEESMRRARLEEEARLEQARLDHEASMERARLEEEASKERARLDHEATIERARLDHEERMVRLQAEREERERQERLAEEERLRQERETEEARLEQARQSRLQNEDPGQVVTEGELESMKGSDTVSLEVAARYLGYDVRHISRLRNKGDLKHAPRNENLITVASLRAYPRRKQRTEKVPVTSNGHVPDTEPIDLNDLPEMSI